MKALTHLEKNKSFWFLVIISTLFFLLRLPSLIEPYWYGDEGIYQTIGIAMNNGRMLYSEIWDNKPPFLYVLYAIFNGDQFLVRLFSLITGLSTIWIFFKLCGKLFNNLKSSIASTILFTIFFATPVIEGNIANAENFMLLPIITAGLLVYSTVEKNKKLKIRTILFLAGLLLSTAFLFKIVGIFDFAAFFIFLFITNMPERFSFSRNKIKLLFKNSASHLLPILGGFLLPILITFLYFISQGALSDFMRAAFSTNVGYVGYGNKFIIPQGLLIVKLLLLFSTVLLVFWKRKEVDKSVIFVILWLSFSLFNAFFSGRPYTHYALTALPATSLMIGLVLSAKRKTKAILFVVLLVCLFLLQTTFKPNYKKSFMYYENASSFLAGKKDLYSYWIFFDRKTPRYYEIASYIKAHTTSEDNIFIWGDSAQVYALSNKLPPSRYTVAYHINQYNFAHEETQIALNKKKPKYIVALFGAPPLNFSLPNYSNTITLQDTVIYERTH